MYVLNAYVDTFHKGTRTEPSLEFRVVLAIVPQRDSATHGLVKYIARKTRAEVTETCFSCF